MSIGAIGGVSGSRQSHINMATYEIYFNDVPSQPQPQPQNPAAAMTAMLRQVLLQVTQPGGGNLGQGGGQRGGGHQGGCYSGSTDAAHGNDGAGAADAALESQGVEDPQDGANGLVDAISGLLAAIAPLLSAMGGGGSGGGGDLSTTDDASHLADLLSASGF